MSSRSFLTLGLGLALVLSSDTRADDWKPARPRLFAEPLEGVYAFKTLPATEGMLFTLDEGGKEKVIWRGKMVNIPYRVIVGRSGKHVVTIDSWGRFGAEHSLVVYGAKGNAVADLKLEDLLTAKEIRSLPAHSEISGLRWAEFAEFDDLSFAAEPELVIRMKHKGWAKVIRLSLSRGQIVQE